MVSDILDHPVSFARLAFRLIIDNSSGNLCSHPPCSAITVMLVIFQKVFIGFIRFYIFFISHQINCFIDVCYINT